jgi:hypothetical protein
MTLTGPEDSRIMKEEVVHYLDMKMHFTEQPEFRAASDRLFVDHKKMGLLQDALEKVHKGGKMALADQKRYRYMELLAEFVHLKDHLQTPSSSWKRILPGNKERLNRELDTAFGPEVHAQCEKFESILTERAKPGKPSRDL